MRRPGLLGYLPFFLSLCLAAQNLAPVITVDHGPNAAAQQAKPYVVMVSLDGFRYDYAKKYGAKHLLALGAQGAIASQGMIPSYPSLTFPNHYTLVTGLYPEHHGIVANNFYDPVRKQRYSNGRSGHQSSTAAGTGARLSGYWRRNRVCAARAFSGPARRRR